MALSHGADYFVHNENGSMRLIGCMILIVIEISVLTTGIVATRISRNKYMRMDENSNLTVRYQTKETYEMSKAMIPAYVASFLVKALNILVLWAYYAANDMSLTGYAQD
ncbi:hypothetical protein PRIPAC_80221 [Pristionchus pacificus]|uniref:Uncharacterized protein n=1 Tax=Pristionchus pacificus TaxID=54126 RepID=A0A2A6CKY7_PRIPA|nr:hypothetical protein PRIPAC_80221 [Pristionchus pacificus]|eukprot:PDM78713.1 hypothetical protein PRIPAC_31292 [Pristionchus pacificus]